MSDVTTQLQHALLEVARLHQDWRYGQVVTNVAAWAGEEEPAELWDASDEQLLQAALNHLRRHGREPTTVVSVR